jgi:hypothetical protein
VYSSIVNVVAPGTQVVGAHAPAGTANPRIVHICPRGRTWPTSLLPFLFVEKLPHPRIAHQRFAAPSWTIQLARRTRQAHKKTDVAELLRWSATSVYFLTSPLALPGCYLSSRPILCRGRMNLTFPRY